MHYDRLVKKYGVLMRAADLAFELNVSKWTVYSWTSDARTEAAPVEFIRTGPKTIRWRTKDVAAYMEWLERPLDKKKAPRKAEPPRFAAS